MPNLPERYALAERLLHKHLQKNVTIKRISRLGGGCINLNLKISSSVGDYVLKLNDEVSADFFQAEAAGLKALADSQTVAVPTVLGVNTAKETPYLLLEYLPPKEASARDWQLFGENLATLHRQRQDYFGWESSNYIGRLPQSNEPHTDWSSFFIEERLMPQLNRAEKLLPNALRRALEELMQRLPQLFPREPAALLHGDLWSGNAHPCGYGVAAIDPAVYFGHREMDLGMTQLFGGFPRIFLEAYQHHYPLKSGWKERLEICNLYPLLVHVNLFGRSYIGGVRQVLAKFS